MNASGVEYKVYSKSETEIADFVGLFCEKSAEKLTDWSYTHDGVREKWEVLPAIDGIEGRKAYSAKLRLYETVDLLLNFAAVMHDTQEKFPDIGLTTWAFDTQEFQVCQTGHLISNAYEASVVEGNPAAKKLADWMAGA